MTGQSAAIPRPAFNYLNLLTQVLMPRTVLLAGNNAQLLRALLAGCEAHPFRYVLTVFAPGGGAVPRRPRSGRGSVRVTEKMPRGRRKLVVVDTRAVSDLEPFFAVVADGGLFWGYGVDGRRGLTAKLRKLARSSGWRMAYQPWGEGIFCAGPPARARRYKSGAAR